MISPLGMGFKSHGQAPDVLRQNKNEPSEVFFEKLFLYKEWRRAEKQLITEQRKKESKSKQQS